jgi:hypothetical protein
MAGLDEDQQRALAAGKWQPTPEGVSVTPPPEVIVGLAPPARAALYSVLARYPQNAHNGAVSFPPETLDARIAESGLQPATIDLFKRMLYRQGSNLFFADDRTLLPMIRDPQERRRAAVLLSRQETYIVRLKIDRQTDVDRLVQYWGGQRRTKDIEPLLESLVKVPGGFALDLVHLLPAIPRRRLYTYPRAGRDEEKNCHWSSFNFYGETPDDRLIEVPVARHELETQYRQVSEPRFGDVVVLVDRETSGVVHSAVYLADDLVFTKNGFGATQPWLYMQLRTLTELYSAHLGKPDGVKVVLFRRKNAPT